MAMKKKTLSCPRRRRRRRRLKRRPMVRRPRGKKKKRVIVPIEGSTDDEVHIFCLHGCGRKYRTPHCTKSEIWKKTLRKLNSHESQRCSLRPGVVVRSRHPPSSTGGTTTPPTPVFAGSLTGGLGTTTSRPTPLVSLIDDASSASSKREALSNSTTASCNDKDGASMFLDDLSLPDFDTSGLDFPLFLDWDDVDEDGSTSSSSSGGDGSDGGDDMLVLSPPGCARTTSRKRTSFCVDRPIRIDRAKVTKTMTSAFPSSSATNPFAPSTTLDTLDLTFLLNDEDPADVLKHKLDCQKAEQLKSEEQRRYIELMRESEEANRRAITINEAAAVEAAEKERARRLTEYGDYRPFWTMDQVNDDDERRRATWALTSKVVEKERQRLITTTAAPLMLQGTSISGGVLPRTDLPTMNALEWGRPVWTTDNLDRADSPRVVQRAQWKANVLPAVEEERRRRLRMERDEGPGVMVQRCKDQWENIGLLTVTATTTTTSTTTTPPEPMALASPPRRPTTAIPTIHNDHFDSVLLTAATTPSTTPPPPPQSSTQEPFRFLAAA